MGPWLSPEDLDLVRRKVPIIYVDILPVRVDTQGVVQAVGLLLRAVREEVISRAIVSGRVLFHESIRQAIVRHVEKDLGPLAMPRLPTSLVPFAVGEYFPTPGSGLYDPRQHAVSLGYVVPVDGECEPQEDALDLAWLTPEEALSDPVQSDLTDGHGLMVRQGLASVGWSL